MSFLSFFRSLWRFFTFNNFIWNIFVRKINQSAIKRLKMFEVINEDHIEKNLEPYFMTEIFSDHRFLVEGKEIPVHRIILATASNYFQAMFTENESFTDLTPMDIQYTPLMKILEYIYTGILKIKDPSVGELFRIVALAHIFQMSNMVDKIAKILEEEFLNDINVLYLLRRALEAKIDSISNACIKHIDRNKGLLYDERRLQDIDGNSLVEILWNPKMTIESKEYETIIQNWITANNGAQKDIELVLEKYSLYIDANKESEYKQLMVLDDVPLVENTEPIKCSGCSILAKQSNGIILKGCLHEFCKKCINKCIINSKAPEIQCPFKTSDYSCSSVLQQSEIKALVTNTEFEEFLQRSLETVNIKAIYCLNKRCNAYLRIDQPVTIFDCSKCSATNCLKCNAVHKLGFCFKKDKKAAANYNRKVDDDKNETKPSAPSGNTTKNSNQYSEFLKNDRCELCNQKFSFDNGHRLHTCDHFFCKLCLKGYILTNIKDELKCPKKYSETCKCDMTITKSDISKVVPMDIFAIYRKNSMVYENEKESFQNRSTSNKNETSQKTVERQASRTDSLSRSRSTEPCERNNDVKMSSQSTAEEPMDQSNSDEYPVNIPNTSKQNQVETTDNTFKCGRCNNFYKIDEIDVNSECKHFICKECIFILVDESDGSLIYCPNKERMCYRSLSQDIIKRNVPIYLFTWFECRNQKRFSGDEETTVYCRNPKCHYVFDVKRGKRNKNCPQCGFTNCLECKGVHGKNKECNNFKSEQLIDKLIETGKYMKCPKCEMIVEKDEGCDFVKCTACNTGICWATKGFRWGPKGEGDTSGGCGCDHKNGKKCTPNCNYCH